MIQKKKKLKTVLWSFYSPKGYLLRQVKGEGQREVVLKSVTDIIQIILKGT